MKRKILSVLVALCMLLCESSMVFAEGEETQLAVSQINFVENTPITNVNGAQRIASGSMYMSEPLKITFNEELDEKTVKAENIVITEQDTARDVTENVILSEDRKTLSIGWNEFRSRETYTITLTSAIVSADGDALAETTYTVSTGLVYGKDAVVDGKALTLVSLNKTILENSDITNGSYINNGIIDGDCAVVSKDSYVTIDLGAQMNIVAVGTTWRQNNDWDAYGTSIYVNADEPASDYGSASASIAMADTRYNGDHTKYDTVVMPVNKEGQYVSFVNLEGAARTYEYYVIAYTPILTVAQTNFINNSTITNVKGAENISSGSVYMDEPMKIAFDKELKEDTVNAETIVITETDTGRDITEKVTLSEDKKSISIAWDDFRSREAYTITLTSEIKSTDGAYLSQASYSITTGIVYGVEAVVDGKSLTLVSVGKKVTAENLSDGSNITNGKIDDDYTVINKNEYATIDLNTQMDVIAVGTTWRLNNDWDAYGTSIYVNADAPVSDYGSASASIAMTDTRYNGDHTKYDTVVIPVNKAGQYVSFVNTGASAITYEYYVLAYVGQTESGVADFSSETPITNVVGGENVVSDSVYRTAPLKITFAKALAALTIDTGVTVTDSVPVTLDDDGKTLVVDVASLKSNKTYTIMTNTSLSTTDGDVVTPAAYIVKTGLISNAPVKDGKIQKLVSAGKTVQRANVSYTAEVANGSNANLQELTNGSSAYESIAETVYLAQTSGEFVTVDLGNEYDVAAVGAACMTDCPWHMYTMNISVDIARPQTAPEADITISDGEVTSGFSIETLANTQNGRYVTFQKATDGGAYLLEAFVIAYVDADSPDAYMVTNIELVDSEYVATSVETKCDGIADGDTILTASYNSSGVMEEVKKNGAVSAVDGYTYKGFVWKLDVQQPTLPQINY